MTVSMSDEWDNALSVMAYSPVRARGRTGHMLRAAEHVHAQYRVLTGDVARRARVHARLVGAHAVYAQRVCHCVNVNIGRLGAGQRYTVLHKCVQM